MAREQSNEVSRCPLCGAEASRVFSIDQQAIADCTDCGHRFLDDPVPDDHVATVYADSYFFGGGAGYQDYTAEAELLIAQGRRYGALLAEHAAPGRLLDVGSAAGFISRGLSEAGWQVTGLEPNASMVRYANDKLGLDVRQGTLETADAREPFDAICLIQVIGHFHDLARSLDRLSALTRPGGLCLIEYWRRESAIARLLGKRWHEYSPPSVLHWFTIASLERAMRDRKFEPVASGAPKKYISGGHAASLLSHKLGGVPGRGILTAPLRMLATAKLPYPPLDLEWRLFRRV